MKQVLPFIFLLFIAACGEPVKENNTTTKNDDTAKASEQIRSNLSFLHDMNALEAVFGNDNWQLIEKNDTSYFYFSRLGDLRVHTYQYKIIKGDSAQVIHGSIQAGTNNLAWNFNNQQLQVTSATKGRAVLSVTGNDAAQYEFIRTDDKHLAVTYPDKRKVVMKKMLPLSLFLVRSNYDYTHATKMAFDTTQYNKR